MNRLILLTFLSVSLYSCGGGDFRQGDVLYLRNKGADMPAYVYGNTTSRVFMILLHGGPGGNGLEYRGGSYVEKLESEIAVVYWDQRGQGSARGNSHDATVGMPLLMDDLDKLVTLLKHEYGSDISLFLFGHSWGGTYGTQYLMSTDRQQQFKGWIEADGAHDIPRLNTEAIKLFISIGETELTKGNNTSDWAEIVNFAKGVDTTNVTADIGGEINSYAYKAENLIAEIKSDDGNGIQPSLLFNPTDPIVSSITGSRTSRLLDESGIEDIALTDSLYKIEIPSLFLWGKYDFVVPPQLGKDAERLVSSTDTEFIQYDFSGHSPMNGEGIAFANDILEFIHRNKSK